MSIDLEAKSLWKIKLWVTPKFRRQEEEGEPAGEAKKELSQEMRERHFKEEELVIFVKCGCEVQ